MDENKEIKKAPKEETVTLSKAEFEGLMSRLESVEKAQNPTIAARPKRVKEYTLRLREMDGKIVVGLKKNQYNQADMKEVRNDMGNPDMLCTVELLDKDGKIEEKKCFFNLDFCNATHEITVPIISTRVEEVLQTSGMTEKVRVDEEYKIHHTGTKVPMDVITDKRFHTIMLPNGEKYELDCDAPINV